MTYDPEVHHRRSIRLRDYDYTTAGAYFVTACVQGKENLLGEIVEGEMVPNAAGGIIDKWWRNVPVHFHHVQLDGYVIMPNHFHGIIRIVGAGSPRPEPGHQSPTISHHAARPITPENQGGETPTLRAPTLGQIVGYFKYQSTKGINCLRDNPGVPVWQRNYYERTLRSEDELSGARRYIRENPMKWETDEENPARA